MTASSSAVPRRFAAASGALGVVAGITEVLDFLLPLWAGTKLGLSGVATGALLATSLAVAFTARFLVGVLTDKLERRWLAAAGGIVIAVGLSAYALSETLAQALVAAVLFGLGDALFTIPARAMAAESVHDDENAFATVTKSEGTGVWVAYIVGLSLLPMTDYAGLFLIGAVTAVLAAAFVASAPSRQTSVPPGRRGHQTRTMRRLLVVVAITAAVETAASLILLLRLTRDLQLELGSIVLVFLPGLIAYSLAPGLAPWLSRRFGRGRTMALSLLVSAVAVSGLTLAPDLTVIAGFWVLTCVSWAVSNPVETTIVSVLSGAALGRGLTRYESAALLGAAAGSLGSGWAFDSLMPWAQAVSGAMLLVACATLAVRTVRGQPVDVVATSRPVAVGQP